jgi:sugar (pentulose or hexulose) kinase
VFPGFTAPKTRWVRAHEPAIFDKLAMVLLPKDYLRLWLTGEACPKCRMRGHKLAEYRHAGLG